MKPKKVSKTGWREEVAACAFKAYCVSAGLMFTDVPPMTYKKAKELSKLLTLDAKAIANYLEAARYETTQS